MSASRCLNFCWMVLRTNGLASVYTSAIHFDFSGSGCRNHIFYDWPVAAISILACTRLVEIIYILVTQPLEQMKEGILFIGNKVMTIQSYLLVFVYRVVLNDDQQQSRVYWHGLLRVSCWLGPLSTFFSFSFLHNYLACL
jgi:hypothetical protein